MTSRYSSASFESLIETELIELNELTRNTNSFSNYFDNIEKSELTNDFFDITLVEVKSTNGNSKSLKEALNNKKYNNVSKAVKLIDGNIGYINNIYTIPLYMAFLLK